jgi:predicted kinase
MSHQKNPTKRAQLIVMAGLPGTGKSSIAGELEKRLAALVLNKDEIRAILFPNELTDFSRDQDDLCMKIMFLIVRSVLKAKPEQPVIIDGRTFSRTYQMDHLLSLTTSLSIEPVIIECICDDAVARQRLDNDLRTGAHPAGNRTYQLYLAVKEKAEPIILDHLVIDTGSDSMERCVERCLAYLEQQAPVDDAKPWTTA